jgi:hypothetical protein
MAYTGTISSFTFISVMFEIFMKTADNYWWFNLHILGLLIGTNHA